MNSTPLALVFVTVLIISVVRVRYVVRLYCHRSRCTPQFVIFVCQEHAHWSAFWWAHWARPWRWIWGRKTRYRCLCRRQTRTGANWALPRYYSHGQILLNKVVACGLTIDKHFPYHPSLDSQRSDQRLPAQCGEENCSRIYLFLRCRETG